MIRNICNKLDICNIGKHAWIGNEHFVIMKFTVQNQ